MLKRTRRLLLAGALVAGALFVHRFIFLGQVMAGRDAFRLFIPDSTLLLQSLRQGELPLWNPYVRLGQPFAATLQSEALYPPEILTTVAFGPILGFTVHHLLHVLAAAVGTYLLGRRLRASVAGSMLAAAAFALSPMLADLHGQRNVVDAACWTPFVLLAALRLARAPGPTSTAWLAGAIAGSFLCGSPETLLWQLALAACVFASAARRKGDAGWPVLAGLWAAALAAAVLIPGVEYALNSTRGAQTDSLEWSTSWPQLASVALPFAAEPRQLYWGQDQWFIVTAFAGTLICALAALAIRRSPRIWPFAATGAALTLLALGRHFPLAEWLLRLPPLSLFRYPAKYLVGVLFCASILAAFGVDRAVVLLRRRRPSWRPIALVLGVTLALLAVAIPVSRLSVFRAGLSSGVLWAVLALGLAAAVALATPRRFRRIVLAGCAALELSTYHLLAVRAGWTEPAKLSRPSALAAAIPRPFEGRVSLDAYRPDDFSPKAVPPMETSRDSLWANRFLEEGLTAAEGYGAPEPQRLDEFHLSQRRNIFDLMGVEYYARTGPPPFPDLTAVAGGGELPTLYRSTTAMPRAFLLHEGRPLQDRIVLERLAHPGAIARRVAMVSEGPVVTPTGCMGSSARITKALHNSLELQVVACQAAYLVVADSYYPGWTAVVDGRDAPVVRADYALRAIPLSAGSHQISMRYRPWSFAIGAALSLLGWAAAIAVVMGARLPVLRGGGKR